jgi:Tol biopolymer transport system component
MSTRSGQWELWSVRKDGSDLRQVSDLRASISIAVWSPDGKRIATTSSTRPPTGLWIFDSSRPATQEAATFFKNPLPQPFSAESWSPDGKLIAGVLLDGGGFPQNVAVWEVATGSVRPMDVPLPPTWESVFGTGGWLPDSRRFLAVSTNGLAVVDSATGRSSPVVVRPGQLFALMNGGRTLMAERLLYDADVWLMERR